MILDIHLIFVLVAFHVEFHFVTFKLVAGIWVTIVTHTSVQMTLAGGYSPGDCDFASYFSPLMMMIIGLEFTVISLTTFISYIFVFTKILKEKSKRTQLGKYLSILLIV